MRLSISGQSITWDDTLLTVSGSDGLYEVEFEFTDGEDLPTWDGISKYAVFKNSALAHKYPDGVYVEIVNGKATIPGAILTRDGKLYVGVFGQNGYYTMPTIWACPIPIKQGCGEGEAAEPSVMTAAQNAIKYGENAKVFAEGGYIVKSVGGTVGDPELVRLSEYTKGAKDYAEEAAESESAAGTSAENAAESAQAAATSEENASGSAAAAADSESHAALSEQNAAESATLAESYAKGGTNTRTGENTDNAKYYKEQAAGSEQNAGQSASSAAADALKAEGYAVGKQDGSDVGSGSPYYQANAKYYKEQAASSASGAAQSASDAASAKTDAQSAKNDAVSAKNAAVDAKDDAVLAKGAAGDSAAAAYASETAAAGSAEDSEAWAVGKRAGQDVPASDDTYHNNAKYYAADAAASAAAAQSAIAGGNFMLVDKDDNNKRYIMSFYIQNKHLCMDLTEYTE